MKKRGQLIYKALIVVIACGLIVLAFIQAGKSYGSKDVFYKLAVAKDITLIINQLYAMPGDVELIYDKDLSKYSILINGNTVKVYSTSLGVTDITATEYNFVGDEIINVKIENPQPLIIKKINGKIFFDKPFKGEGGSGGGAGSAGRW